MPGGALSFRPAAGTGRLRRAEARVADTTGTTRPRTLPWIGMGRPRGSRLSLSEWSGRASPNPAAGHGRGSCTRASSAGGSTGEGSSEPQGSKGARCRREHPASAGPWTSPGPVSSPVRHWRGLRRRGHRARSSQPDIPVVMPTIQWRGRGESAAPGAWLSQRPDRDSRASSGLRSSVNGQRPCRRGRSPLDGGMPASGWALNPSGCHSGSMFMRFFET